MRNSTAMLLERAIHHILSITPMPNREDLLRYLDCDTNHEWQGVRPPVVPWQTFTPNHPATYDPALRPPPIVVHNQRNDLPEGYTMEFRQAADPSPGMILARQRLEDQTLAAMGMLAAAGLPLPRDLTATEVQLQALQQRPALAPVGQAQTAREEYQRWADQETERLAEIYRAHQDETRFARDVQARAGGFGGVWFVDENGQDLPEDRRPAGPTATPQQPAADGAW